MNFLEAEPSISIITSTYNRAHTLERLFQALQDQTLINFEWILIDDGSTDQTENTVEKLVKQATFPIRYYKQENQHKFITFFKGIGLAKGKCIMLADSDDSYPTDTIEILFREVEKLPSGKFYGVAGLSKDIKGNRIGEEFPVSPLDASYFEMRYKYKVKGEQSALALKEVYQKINIDFSKYQNKGFIPESIINYQLDSLGYKIRFINEVVRIYITNETDSISLANSFYSDKNSFGLCENYKYFINCYKNKFFNYPKTYIKNLVAYVLFGLKDKRSIKTLIKDVQGISLKTMVLLVVPFVYPFKNKEMK